VINFGNKQYITFTLSNSHTSSSTKISQLSTKIYFRSSTKVYYIAYKYISDCVLKYCRLHLKIFLHSLRTNKALYSDDFINYIIYYLQIIKYINIYFSFSAFFVHLIMHLLRGTPPLYKHY